MNIATGKSHIVAVLLLLLQFAGSYPPWEEGPKLDNLLKRDPAAADLLLLSHDDDSSTRIASHDWNISRNDLNESVLFASRLVDRLHRLETNLAWSKIRVRWGSASHGRYIDSRPESEALRQGKNALIAAKATLYLKNSVCRSHALDEETCLKFLSNYTMFDTPLQDSCPRLSSDSCPPQESALYRSADGSCNNLRNALWGKSFGGYGRLLPPRYSDGVQEMRRFSSAADKGMPLLSPRLISTTLQRRSGGGLRSTNSGPITLAVTQWGQFVEHDLAQTTIYKMIYEDSTIECCDVGGFNLSPRYKHPLCAPISVPQDNSISVLTKHELACISYVRSIAAMPSNCVYGPVEQLNQATHFLDASQIYGSDSHHSRRLRKFQGGLLRGSRKNRHSFLQLASSGAPGEHCLYDGTCFVSGDSRVNSHPQLAAMHTLWYREHNRLAMELAILRPDWDDETLYQEARRIVIAEIQHITYDQWIPEVLGSEYREKIGSFEDAYSDSVDPSVSNSFATAAMRIFDSSIRSVLELFSENRRVSKTLQLKQYLYKPSIIEKHGHLDQILRGLTTQSATTSSDSTNLSTNEIVRPAVLQDAADISDKSEDDDTAEEAAALDVLSLDIQRGRDHGLPGYNAFRKLCHLHDATSFSDFSDIMEHESIELLRTMYAVPNDVDLLAGALLETPIRGSIFGHTFSCIVADQFLRSRLGDRYFYTNSRQPRPFSTKQLEALKKVTLARVLCDNGDNIQAMQPNVFQEISSSNALVSCIGKDIPRLNLTLFV